jgi:hypothetical protein
MSPRIWRRRGADEPERRPRRNLFDEADDPLDGPVFATGRGHVPKVIDAPFVVEDPEPPPVVPALDPTALPPKPPPPLRSYTRRRPLRRDTKDRMALVVALIVSSVVMAACCLAGLAFFSASPGF